MVSFICAVFIYFMVVGVNIFIILLLDKNNGVDEVMHEVMFLGLVFMAEIAFTIMIAFNMMGGLDG